MSTKLEDVSYWLVLQISKHAPPIDLTKAYQGSLELDYLYQVLTNKTQNYWLIHHDEDLSPILINNAFFRALSFLQKRNMEYLKSRENGETDWIKDLLHL